MPTNDAKKKYDIQYAKDKLKRIPLDVKKEKYEEIKAAADAVGEPINGYIKKAIDERIEREGVLSAAGQKQPTQATVPKPIAPEASNEKTYKPFTEEDAKRVNLQELLSNFRYQLDISDSFGMDVLTTLLEKARQQAAEK